MSGYTKPHRNTIPMIDLATTFSNCRQLEKQTLAKTGLDALTGKIFCFSWLPCAGALVDLYRSCLGFEL